MKFAMENDERQGEIADSGLATGGSMFHEQTKVFMSVLHVPLPLEYGDAL
jgi:hypothetical protein